MASKAGTGTSTEVYIKLPTGRSSLYHTYPSQKLLALCEQVAAEEKVQASQVNLKYQGKTLDSDKTIAEYGVRIETILKAEILIPQDLDIVITYEDGTPSEEAVISNLEPVSRLFNEISTKRDVPSARLMVKIEGRNLANSSTRLMDAGIARGSTVVVTIKSVESAAAAKSTEETPAMDETERQNVLSSFNSDGKPVEVAFSFDTTGSMYGYLTQVRQKLRECCSRLVQDIPNIRISIIAQGDYCDSVEAYAVRVLDLTSDVQSLVDFANNVPATSGGDSPECYELVLKRAQQLDWSENSAKALVVIGDLHPHPPSYTDQNISWRDELDLLTGLGVKVYGVQAGGNCDATLFYRELAAVSGGCHLSLGHMDVITDMFLAVCYNEGEEEMLENFEQELEAAGNMTEQKQEMFKELKEKSKEGASNAASSRSGNRTELSQPWWDTSLDQGTPSYRFDTDTDKWLPIAGFRASRVGAAISRAASASPSSSRSSRRRSAKHKCCIM